MMIDHYPGGLRIGYVNHCVNKSGDFEPFEIKTKSLILIVVNGRQVFSVDGQVFKLESCAGESEPCALTITVQDRAVVQYLQSSGHPLRKLAIAWPQDWFHRFRPDPGANDPQNSGSGGVNGAAAATTGSPSDPGHEKPNVSVRLWTPDKHVTQLATQIILPPEGNVRQIGLFRMSRGIEILHRLSDMQQMADQPARVSGTQIEGCRKAEDIRLYILQHLEQDLTTGELENRFCRSRRSLQRLFKSEYGVGIAEFVRHERLKQANLALQNDGISIAEAAFRAGYSSPANFATAFRRAFGIVPTQARSCMP